MSSEGVCENCDRPDDDIAPVYRVYVTPESWDTAGAATRMDQVEHWCFSCRSMYPHDPVEP